MNEQQPKYKFYATLLDGFQELIDSSEIWQQYWGNSANPSKTIEEFEAEQFGSLIDRINRVPFDSEPADRGTAFNEVIDMMILKTAKSDKITAVSDKERGVITATMIARPERRFEFPIAICCEFADYYKGATPQVYTEAVIDTIYGGVLLYGYIDELMPLSVHDIKTTGKYSVGKFRNNWQHKVYPYCLAASGAPVDNFEYNVAAIDSRSGAIETFTEQYTYRAERDVPALQGQCEALIDFLHANRALITDKKIFALD